MKTESTFEKRMNDTPSMEITPPKTTKTAKPKKAKAAKKTAKKKAN